VESHLMELMKSFATIVVGMHTS